MNKPTSLEQVRAEQFASYTAKLVKLHEELGYLIKWREKAGYKNACHQTLLWAEFEFYKANYEYCQSEEAEAELQVAADNLGVDMEGNELPDLGDNEADYRYDEARAARDAA